MFQLGRTLAGAAHRRRDGAYLPTPHFFQHPSTVSALTRRSTFSHKETFAQKPNGDSVVKVGAGRFGMADRVLGQLSLADGLAASDET
ncbi:hypothetical protein, partial [Mesorhizobium sp. M6A.T.Ce.TU.016.01.1.1]|uniref:hypothetical protein n=1 Tax=Mesorhizobium sp. M6A.T.Ce.TU.016.01.1.1 TaxID=2496783 RepID=UPI001AEC8FAD